MIGIHKCTTFSHGAHLLEGEVTNRIDRFENYDLETIVTRINADTMEQLLIETNYNKEEIKFWMDGFRYGFSLEYQGSMYHQNRSGKLHFRLRNKTILWNKIMKEVKAGRVAGPYKESEFPFDEYLQAPLGLVLKSGNKACMIFHLSYDFVENKSVNYHTSENLCKVQYNDLDETVRASLNLRTELVFYAKTNVCSAFKLIPTNTWSWRQSMMQPEDPET